MAKKKPPSERQTKRTASRTGRRPEAEADWAPAFLDALRKLGTVHHACLKAKVGRATVYQRRDGDPEFKAAMAAAHEDALDVMEREAIRRGCEGYDEPVVYKGRIAGEWVGPDGLPCEASAAGARFVPVTVRKYSDRLLASLLRWKRYPAPAQPGEDDEPEFAQEE